MMKRIFVMFMAMTLVIAMVGCGKTEVEGSTAENNFPKSIVIASGPIGGPWYASCTKISEVLMREIPGLTVSVIEGGAESNLDLINEGVDATFAMTSSVALQQLTDGTKKSLENISGFMPVVTSYIQVATPADGDIHSFSDIVGKNVSPGKKGFASEVIFSEIMKAYDISYDDIEENGGKVDMLSWGEYPDMIADGHLDVVALNGEAPHNIYMQIEVNKPLRVLSIDAEQKEKVLTSMPSLFTKIIPAGTYAGTPTDIELFGYSGVLAVNDSVSDEFVLKIMDTLQENKEEIQNELKYVNLLGWENATSGLSEKVTREAVWSKIQSNQ